MSVQNIDESRESMIEEIRKARPGASIVIVIEDPDSGYTHTQGCGIHHARELLWCAEVLRRQAWNMGWPDETL